MDNSSKYTNTVIAAAYSLGVHPEVLQQSLGQMRKITKKLKSNDETDFFLIHKITISLNKSDISKK
jgi:hypothetical protein